MEGIYLIDKPEGFSSYDCIRKLKKALDFRKIGHSGTLDPFASGLLVVLVGKATKLANVFLNDDKEYIGTISFGCSTDSYDKTGVVTKQLTDFYIDEKLINEAFNQFIGEILQKPPLFSALKYEGKPLYDYARKEEFIEVKKRKVKINEFKSISSYYNNKIDFMASVSKGTYLRSLAYDVGLKLNIPTHLYSLRRTKSGIFNVDNAYKITDIKPGIKPSITIEKYAKTLEKITIKPYLEPHILNGIQLDNRQTTTKNIFAVYKQDNSLLAIYKPVKDKYSPIIVLGE